jgi:hypothetical protein
VAKHLLKHERGGSAASPALLHSIARIRDAAKATLSPFGGMLADDAVFQRDLGELEADILSYVISSNSRSAAIRWCAMPPIHR